MLLRAVTIVKVVPDQDRSADDYVNELRDLVGGVCMDFGVVEHLHAMVLTDPAEVESKIVDPDEKPRLMFTPPLKDRTLFKRPVTDVDVDLIAQALELHGDEHEHEDD